MHSSEPSSIPSEPKQLKQVAFHSCMKQVECKHAFMDETRLIVIMHSSEPSSIPNEPSQLKQVAFHSCMEQVECKHAFK